jgi:SAM-dependent MidA family methyltransferase
MNLFTQKLPGKLKTLWNTIVLVALLLCVSQASVFASDAELSEIKEQQKKLQEILGEISDVREQRAEQKALLEKLSQKMQCNWDLIQDYDACDKKYNEQKQEKLNCAQKAKERASDCLSEIGK